MVCLGYKLLPLKFYSATHLCWPEPEVPKAAETNRIYTSRLFFFCCSVEVKAAAWSPRGEKITGTQGHRDESVRGGAERKIGRKVSGFRKKQTMVTPK